MLLVREVFTAKPGMASQLAKMMKEQMAEAKVMTDIAGPYNTVVVEYEVASLAEWEEHMKKMMAEGKKLSKSSGPSHTDLYTTGRREMFRLW